MSQPSSKENNTSENKSADNSHNYPYNYLNNQQPQASSSSDPNNYYQYYQQMTPEQYAYYAQMYSQQYGNYNNQYGYNNNNWNYQQQSQSSNQAQSAPNNNNNRYRNNNNNSPYQQHRNNNNYSPNRTGFNNRNSPTNNNQNRANNFNSNNQNKQKNFNKKQKVDKRDLPENNKYYCEVCDRGFKEESKYKEHCDTHETCGINGCKFTAAAKLVEIHYRNFHATGLDKKCSKLQSPEELQRYIEERKKNFPSADKTKEKESLDEEKQKRGAVLDTREFGRFKKSKHQHHNDQARKASPMSENGNSNDNTDQTLNKNKKMKKKNKNKHMRSGNALDKPKKPTLLQKLLADEIRHERNILLQCVKYITENNFFDKNETKEGST